VALAGVADRITAILPWGGLLRAVAAPEIESLRHIARLCLPKASIEIVLSHDEQRDVRQSAPLRVGGLDEEHMRTTLPRLYEQAGLLIVAAEQISQRELADCQPNSPSPFVREFSSVPPCLSAVDDCDVLMVPLA
jgi:hypothetical protein